MWELGSQKFCSHKFGSRIRFKISKKESIQIQVNQTYVYHLCLKLTSTTISKVVAPILLEF
jgi:hypothetical protein